MVTLDPFLGGPGEVRKLPLRGRYRLMNREELSLLLIEASAYPLGAVVKTNAPEVLRTKLYPVMRELGIRLTLAVPATPGELWIVKKN